jgi:hypothetical protein
MNFKALLLLISTITAQSASTNWIAGTSDFNYQLSLSGNLLTVWVHKNRQGFLAFGFGSGIENGDIFVIQPNGGGLTIQSCHLAGQQVPVCGGNLWVLQTGTLNSDGSWTAQVTRDITQASSTNITITPNAINNLLYYYSDSHTLDIGQNTPSDMFGTLQTYLGQDIPTGIDSANPVTNNNTNGDPSSGPVFGSGSNGTANSTTNPDGSVTTTVVNPDGSLASTTVFSNGTIILTTTSTNGTATTNTTTSTNVNSNGTITTNTTVTNTTSNGTNTDTTTTTDNNNNSGQEGCSSVLKSASLTFLALLVTLSIN